MFVFENKTYVSTLTERFYVLRLNEPRREKWCLRICEKCGGSDHSVALIVMPVPLLAVLQYPVYFYSEGSDITKICLYNFDPLKPHFYIVKLGFTGVYIIFLISAQKHRLWVLVRTASPKTIIIRYDIILIDTMHNINIINIKLSDII